MSKSVEIIDKNYVSIDAYTLLNMRTSEKISVEEAVKRGVVKAIEEPDHDYFNRKVKELLEIVTKRDLSQACGVIVGVISKTEEGGAVLDTHMVGYPELIFNAINAIGQRAAQHYGEGTDAAPPETKH